jgi:hypothetical protein
MIATSTVHLPVGSDPFTAILVTAIVLALGFRVSKRVARVQGDQRLVKLLMLSLILHLLCAPAQIWVVDHVYNGVADYNAYVNRGAALAQNLRAGTFSFANTNIRGYTGDNMVYIASGVVQTVLGINKLAEFIVFTGLAFLGEIAFLRAFSITFPEANPRRYALLILFLPSLLFWTADVSKETIMTFALGVAAYGAARVLQRLKGGYRILIPGVAIGLILRPNEVILLLGGLTVAMFFRSSDQQQRFRGMRRILTLVFLAGALAVAAYATEKLFKESGGLSSQLEQLTKNNSAGSGAGTGSSNVAYSPNPLFYFRDVYTVLFDPLPITAHGKSELLAGLENTVLLVLILSSFRQLRCIFRASVLRPYVLLCTIYSLMFMYAFAALGNLGLIYRERTLLLPFLLVLLAIPIAKPGSQQPKFPWEKRIGRRRQRKRSAAGAQGLGVRT